MLCRIVAGLVCSILGFILLVIGISTNYWLANDTYHLGLWKLCSEDICVDIQGIGYINATRGLAIFSAIILIVGIIFSGLTLKKICLERTTACLVSAILEEIAGIILVIGMSIYKTNTAVSSSNEYFYYQWSFFVTWIANVLIFVSGICHFRAYRLWPLSEYESV